MKILFIPLEAEEAVTNERSRSLERALAKRHEIIGVRKKRRYTTLLEFAWYIFRVFWFGIRKAYAKQVDVIWCEQPFYALVGSSISFFSRKPCIWSSHNFGRNFCRDTRKSRRYTWAYLAMEKTDWRFSRIMVIDSEADRQAFIEQGFAAERIVTLPLSANLTLTDAVVAGKADLRSKLGLDQDRRILIFIGKRDYPPNMEAARWINDELAPALAHEFTNIQILMTGGGEIPENEHHMVSYTGFVPDIYEYIHASDICLSPMWSGAGILTKMIDYMACGKPVVASSFSAGNIPELEDGLNAVIAAGKEEFIRKTIQLINNFETAEQMGKHAREIVENHYNWDVLEEKLFAVIEKAVQ